MLKKEICIFVVLLLFSMPLLAIEKKLLVFAEIIKPHGQDSIFVDVKQNEYFGVYDTNRSTFIPLEIDFSIGSKIASVGETFSMRLLSQYFQCDIANSDPELIKANIEYEGNVLDDTTIKDIQFTNINGGAVYKDIQLNLVFPDIGQHVESRLCEGSFSFIFELGNI